jgi:branched-chain amino acid transport system permease protein
MSNLVQSLIDAISMGSLFALMALGIGLVFGIMRLVNFAHGELVMVGGYGLLLLAGSPDIIAAVLVIGLVILVALTMERVAFRPLRQRSVPTLLIGSFTVSFLLQNLVLMTIGATPRGVNFGAPLLQSVSFGKISVSYLQIVMIVTTLVLLAGLASFLKYSRYGIQMRAAAENFRMARLLGVKANRIIAVAFAGSGLLAGVVSLLYVAQIGALTPQLGLQPAVVGFVATVIGGLGSLAGAAIGGFVIGSLTVLIEMMLPLELRPFRDAFLYSVLFALLLVRPRGIIILPWARERV